MLTHINPPNVYQHYSRIPAAGKCPGDTDSRTSIVSDDAKRTISPYSSFYCSTRYCVSMRNCYNLTNCVC